jgi:hypothetical protein
MQPNSEHIGKDNVQDSCIGRVNELKLMSQNCKRGDIWRLRLHALAIRYDIFARQAFEVLANFSPPNFSLDNSLSDQNGQMKRGSNEPQLEPLYISTLPNCLNWRPMWYYMLDVCTVNSFLISKGN